MLQQWYHVRPFEVINIGNGEVLLVLKMVNEFEIQSGKTVRYQVGLRRLGVDVKAINKIGFKTARGINAMRQDTWDWQSVNSMGYIKNEKVDIK